MRKLAGVAVLAVGAVSLAGCGLGVDALKAPAPVKTTCTISSAVHDGYEAWAVAGATPADRGSTLTFTVTADGVTQTSELVVRAGGTLLADGTIYGDPDGYTDDGTNTFGTDDTQVIVLTVPHGPVSARVTQGTQTVCSYR